MKDLFLSEWRRFRTAALVFAAIHLTLQLFVNRLTDFPQARWELHLIALIAYVLCGLGFAFYQFGSYRQRGRWVWLLHRPLPRPAIFGSIAAASLALILLAIGLPALLSVLGVDLLTARTVDLRHYMLVVHLVLFTAIAWLAGACVMLSHTRLAIVILLLPAVVLLRLASGFDLLLPALACAALLAAVAYAAFKPDRLTPPGKPWLLAATAVPLLVGFYLALLWSGSLLFQSVQMLAGAHPVFRAVPIGGGYIELLRAEGVAAFELGLADSAHPRAAHWRRQLSAATVGDIEPMGRQFPVRHQVSNREEIGWDDEKRHLHWTFSHDAMRFEGRDMRTGAARGWMGVHGLGDAKGFPAVPVMPRAGWIMTPQHLYQVDPESQAVHELLRLDGDEVLAWPGRHVGNRRYTLTNQRLIAHPPAQPSPGTAPLEASYSVDLPGPLSDLQRIDIAELVDGTLLSFDFGRTMSDGHAGSFQTVMFVDHEGKAQVLARRALAHDFPLLFEHRQWWISPLLGTVLALPGALIDSGEVADRGPAERGPADIARPAPVVAAAVAAALLSAMAAAWWLRGTPVSRQRKHAWVLACLALGPPCLACLALLQPRPARAPSLAPPGLSLSTQEMP